MSRSQIHNVNHNKLIAIFVMILWPFMGGMIALQNFKRSFSKILLIGGISFMGMTAASEGDLERYEAMYHINSSLSISEMWANLVGLQDGKFYINALVFVLNLFTTNYHIYFAVLYLIFGYYLVNFIYLFFDKKIVSTKTVYGFLFFLSFALFFSIRNSLILAFHTGVIFYMYYMSKAILYDNKKIMLFVLFAPLLHFSLVLLYIPTVLYIYLKNKPLLCAILVIATLGLSKSSVNSLAEEYASTNKGTLIEQKYRSYGSDYAMEYLEQRYEDARLNSNWKLKTLNIISDIIFNYLTKIGLVIVLLYRKKLGLSKLQINMLSFVLLLWAICNLALSFSVGDRFLILFASMAYALFLLLSKKAQRVKLFYLFTLILVPFSLLFGLMNLYASNLFISKYFFFSNFLIELF